MSNWDTLAARMDAIVDENLGDDIVYRPMGGPALGDAGTIKGFVLDDYPGLSVDYIDDNLQLRKRVKVAKSIVATVNKADRIQHSRLGAGWFAPTGKLPATQGRYWVFDVIKATG